MSRQNLFRLVGLFILVILVAACDQESQLTEEPPSPTFVPATSTSVPAATRTPTPQPSSTAPPSPIPATATPTPTATASATPSPSPSPTATATPVPTLEPEPLRAFVRDMLETNGGCELPCWWGITPGETTWDDMQAFFTQRGIEIDREGLELDNLNPEASPLRYRSRLGVNFLERDGVVQSIRVRNGSFYDPYPQELFLGPDYGLDQVLARYGRPSEVYLSLVVGAGCAGSGIVPQYELWVVYNDRGMAFQYPGALIRDNHGWHLCPQPDRVKGMEIWLQSPDADQPVIRIDSMVGDFEIDGTLNQVTGMSLGDFQRAFQAPASPVCLWVDEPYPWTELVVPGTPERLSPEAEDDLLIDMLQSNAGCELPCWWGIRPGQTSWESARQTFEGYGKSIVQWGPIQWGTAYQVGLFGRHGPYPFDYVVQHTLFVEEGGVQLIGVEGHALDGPTWLTPGWPPTQHFEADWARYSLAQVLARFGPPSQVRLHYWPYANTLYSLAVIYDDLGIMVSYMGGVFDERDQLDYAAGSFTTPLDPTVLCPLPGRITDINLWLRAPGTDVSLAEVFGQFAEGYHMLPANPDRTPSLQEATGMSLETFYQTYLDPETATCLEADPAWADMIQ